MESSELLGVLKVGGGNLGMGSAAEEKTNGWSEDEADSLLSLGKYFNL